MGSMCSRRFPDEGVPRSHQPLAAAYDARRGRYGPGDLDSGELAIPPPKAPPSHMLQETSVTTHLVQQHVSMRCSGLFAECVGSFGSQFVRILNELTQNTRYHKVPLEIPTRLERPVAYQTGFVFSYRDQGSR